MRDVEKAIQLLKTTKLSKAEIARQTGCSIYQIEKFKCFLGVKRGIDLALLDKLIHDKTKTQKEIAELCNCSQSTVHRRSLKVNGNKKLSVKMEKAILILQDPENMLKTSRSLAGKHQISRWLFAKAKKYVKNQNKLIEVNQ